MNVEKNTSFLKKDTLMYKSNEVSFCLERGGIITSLKFSGKEILYFDEETFLDINKSIRGGIPILFPNAGPVEKDSPLNNLPQHGFIRNMQWKGSLFADHFENIIESNKDTFLIYPYSFKLSIKGCFKKNAQFSLVQKIENTGITTLPVSVGLHPYFKVKNNEKKNINFNFRGGDVIKEKFDKWSEGDFVSIDNPKKYNNDAVLNVDIPGLGTLVLDYSKEYQKIWVWSLPGKDFICIEPVMRNINGINDDPGIVLSGQFFNTKISIGLQ